MSFGYYSAQTVYGTSLFTVFTAGRVLFQERSKDYDYIDLLFAE